MRVWMCVRVNKYDRSRRVGSGKVQQILVTVGHTYCLHALVFYALVGASVELVRRSEGHRAFKQAFEHHVCSHRRMHWDRA